MINKTFIVNKPLQILMFLAKRSNDEPIHISRLAVDANTTYAHTSTCISFLTAKGLCTSTRVGRCNFVALTASGLSVAQSLLSAEREFNSSKDNVGVL